MQIPATIYILKNGQQDGPYNPETLLQMLKNGSVSATELAWTEGLEDWQALSTLLGIDSSNTSASPPRRKTGASGWLKLALVVAILMIVVPVALKLLKTASNIGEILSFTPPQMIMDSKLHMFVDGAVIPMSTNTLGEIISELKSRGLQSSWSNGDDGSWILSVFKHDALTESNHETRLQLVHRNQQTIVARGTQDGIRLDENQLNMMIITLSGDLERAIIESNNN